MGEAEMGAQDTENGREAGWLEGICGEILEPAGRGRHGEKRWGSHSGNVGDQGQKGQFGIGKGS